MSQATPGTIKLLGFNGSLRKDSYSGIVLKAVKDQCAEKATLDIFPLNDIPLYNEDLDTEENRPESVQRFKTAIKDAAGLVIVGPEYNYGITGVLKNAIDWASRPAFTSVLKDKPVLLISSSIAFTGGVRALAQTKLALMATLSRVVPHPDIVVGAVQNKVTDGKLTDDLTLGFISQGIDALLAEIR